MVRAGLGVISNKCPKEVLLKDVPALTEIKKQLPSHVFKSDMWLSLYYLARDLAMLSLLFGTMYWCFYNLQTTWLYVTMPLLIFAQGTVMWALFVIGHDCGHGSFSKSRNVNLACGLLAHTLIMVPYTPWKLTHRKHHKNTGHIDNDEVFCPVRESQHEAHNDIVYILLSYMVGVGWFLYLAVGAEVRGKWAHHYWPFHYEQYEKETTLSLCALLVMSFSLFEFWARVGTLAIATLYFAPLLVFASWLVITTFLHHNDEHHGVAWYSGDDWNYVKGNLSSIDRTFGSFLDEITHNIATHQVHHLFPAIPHYHLKEATVAFRKAYGSLARESAAPIVPSFVRQCTTFVHRRVVSDKTTAVIV